MGDELETSARILIVDDHEDNVELLRARLESWGYTTESAMDGGQALEKVEASPPDLILLDVMMPHIDGMEVARRVPRVAFISSSPRSYQASAVRPFM